MNHLQCYEAQLRLLFERNSMVLEVIFEGTTVGRGCKGVSFSESICMVGVALFYDSIDGASKSRLTTQTYLTVCKDLDYFSLVMNSPFSRRDVPSQFAECIGTCTLGGTQAREGGRRKARSTAKAYLDIR